MRWVDIPYACREAGLMLEVFQLIGSVDESCLVYFLTYYQAAAPTPGRGPQ